jgi:K+-transporting ATPase ATPase C chain
MTSMIAMLRTAGALFLTLSLLTGVVYPLAVTVVAQTFFPHQANGSLLMKDGKAVGSELIAQPFDAPHYFWQRPSATSPFPCNAGSSSGSNLGPTNPDQIKAVTERIAAIREAHPGQAEPVPVDLVTASASGLDPHLSPAAIDYQIARVAKARGANVQEIMKLVEQHTETRTLGVLGEPRVNVLRLNLALDAMKTK